MIILCAVVATAANAFLRNALAGKLGWSGSVMRFLRDAIPLSVQPSFIIGGILFITATMIWMLIMGTCPMSFAYPAQIDLVTVFTTVCTWLVFSEAMTPQNWIGLVVIVIGVLLVRK